jgi:SAM-dependent methyltransferase
MPWSRWAGWAAFIGRPYHWQAWAYLLHCVRTGETAFQHVHGVRGWEYRAGDAEELAIFDRSMTDLSRRASRTVLDAYDFERFASVVDVGGASGAFLAALLARYPTMRGVLFDQAHVVDMAHGVLQAAGVADRCRVVSGSFFEAVPDGGDAYLLKAVLHDWDDEAALAILRVCRRAVAPGRVLLVVEPSQRRSRREIVGPRDARRQRGPGAHNRGIRGTLCEHRLSAGGRYPRRSGPDRHPGHADLTQPPGVWPGAADEPSRQVPAYLANNSRQ